MVPFVLRATRGYRSMKALPVAFLLIAFRFACAQDSGSVLAQILARRGTISKAELAQVESAAPAERVRALTALLESKGMLSAAEVAKVNGPAAPVPPAALV